MGRADDLEDALDALAALIKAKLEGASDLSEFYNRRLGALGINPAASLDTLLDLFGKMSKAAAMGGDLGEETIVYL